MDDFRKIIYVVLVGFILIIVFWVSFVTLSGCGFALNCAAAAPKVDRTSIPTLIPATLPLPTHASIPTVVAVKPVLSLSTATLPPSVSPVAQPATAAETSPTSSPSAAQTQAEPEATTEEIARPSNPGGPGEAINLTGNAAAGATVFAENCETCHNTEGKGGIENAGSADGTVPPLNPIDPTIKSPDYKTFATNLDLFIQHGSTPEGVSPERSMPAWGDLGKLTQQQIADVIAYIISLNQ
jgi:mono/diheme cytochrome c family protein